MSVSSPTVSVVIPVYNGAPFIAFAVESVLAQRYQPEEIIVVNDGSVDGTLQVLERFGSRIKVISIPNGGVSNARNVGIHASTGELIAFLDADDIWDPDKLRLQVQALQAFPTAGLCCCDFMTYNWSMHAKTNHFGLFSGDPAFQLDRPFAADAFGILIRYNFVGTASTVVVRKALLDQVGLFDVSYRQAEDYDLWLRCALHAEVISLSKVLVDKRAHDRNLTNDFAETLQFHERVLLSWMQTRGDVFAQRGLWESALAALAQTRYQIGNLLFEKGLRFQAFGYYFRGLRSVWSLSNLRAFLYYVSRKVVRMLSFGMIRNRRPIGHPSLDQRRAA
ncbi:Glycosyltransferase involved in cell wall bisynthesis [Noviherbaspirillum humi]|uniref:Glycosyltransferase involved in cell wall bisynthesis n=1 Tax=Noviherbaspirillum humi TaxID=1688639 RepID=A0A239GWE2_9BURK|nr:glycosyltransferase family 2 protein [Noviherbaspirillum humi]SNS73202.1 Glycosyltransferase involved in cell wall bisynthesis [Noviherbaspirillum humi]